MTTRILPSTRLALAFLIAASLALPALSGLASASPPPLPPVPALPLPPMNFTGTYNATTHAVHLHWQAPLGAGNQSIEFRVYLNGALSATVATTLWNGTININQTMVAYTVTAYYPTAASPQHESAPAGPVIFRIDAVCWPVSILLLTSFPFVVVEYDPGCVPPWIPGPNPSNPPVRIYTWHR